jgi:HSP20 family protein
MPSTALEPRDSSHQTTSLRNVMDRFLAQSFFAPFEPLAIMEEPLLAIDLDESEDAYILRTSLPGVKPDYVQVEIYDATVRIHGEMEEEQPSTKSGKKCRALLQERYHGVIQRTITLSTPVDATNTTATFTYGVLTLTLPKTEQSKVLRIPIKTMV